MIGLEREINNKKETYKLLGITICKIDKSYNFKSKNILNFITKEKTFNNYIETQYLKIFDKIIYKRTETLDDIDISVLKFINRHISKLSQVKKDLAKTVNKRYSKIFILKSNLGETYLFLKYIINELLTGYDFPIILATKESHVSLIKMLTPHLRYKLIKPLKYEINDKIFKIGEQTVYTIYPLKFYLDTENKIQKTDICYLNEMYNYFKISNENIRTYNKIRIPSTIKNEINSYLQENSIDKFIFIAKEATTVAPIPNEFWEKLEEKLNIKIIYNNSKNNIIKSYYLSQKASAIISLRSGLSEILSDGDTTHIVLYTDFKNRYRFKSIEKNLVINSYSIKNIESNRNNIIEIPYTQQNENLIINEIVKTIKKREGVR